MKVYLDHDRAPTGIVVLNQSTFFSRDVDMPDKLVEQIGAILDAATGLRACLAQIYQQPDGRIRSVVASTLIEEITRICAGVNGDEKPKQQDTVVPLKRKSPGRPKKAASSSSTSQNDVQ